MNDIRIFTKHIDKMATDAIDIGQHIQSPDITVSGLTQQKKRADKLVDELYSFDSRFREIIDRKRTFRTLNPEEETALDEFSKKRSKILADLKTELKNIVKNVGLVESADARGVLGITFEDKSSKVIEKKPKASKKKEANVYKEAEKQSKLLAKEQEKERAKQEKLLAKEQEKERAKQEKLLAKEQEKEREKQEKLLVNALEKERATQKKLLAKEQEKQREKKQKTTRKTKKTLD